MNYFGTISQFPRATSGRARTEGSPSGLTGARRKEVRENPPVEASLQDHFVAQFPARSCERAGIEDGGQGPEQAQGFGYRVGPSASGGVSAAARGGRRQVGGPGSESTSLQACFDGVHRCEMSGDRDEADTYYRSIKEAAKQPALVVEILEGLSACGSRQWVDDILSFIEKNSLCFVSDQHFPRIWNAAQFLHEMRYCQDADRRRDLEDMHHDGDLYYNGLTMEHMGGEFFGKKIKIVYNRSLPERIMKGLSYLHEKDKNCISEEALATEVGRYGFMEILGKAVGDLHGAQRLGQFARAAHIRHLLAALPSAAVDAYSKMSPERQREMMDQDQKKAKEVGDLHASNVLHAILSCIPSSGAPTSYSA